MQTQAADKHAAVSVAIFVVSETRDAFSAHDEKQAAAANHVKVWPCQQARRKDKTEVFLALLRKLNCVLPLARAAYRQPEDEDEQWDDARYVGFVFVSG